MEKIWITDGELIFIDKSEKNLKEIAKLTLKAESHGETYGFVMDLFKGINLAASGGNSRALKLFSRSQRKTKAKKSAGPDSPTNVTKGTPRCDAGLCSGQMVICHLGQ